MVPCEEYRQFSGFLELIETMSSERRTESVTFRDGTGKAAGLLTLDEGQVRFGVEVAGRLYIDEIFSNEAPRQAVALQKIQNRVTLTKLEKELLAEPSPRHRAALCGLTARALRKIAALWAVANPQARRPELGLPQLRLLSASFWVVELALAAGRRGNLRADDAAVRVYAAPPEHAEECWLFQWQSDKLGSPWPVQANRLGERRVGTIVSFGGLAQRLSNHIAARRRSGDREALRAQLSLLGDRFFYIVSSARYMTLLGYELAHLGRIVRALESFIAEPSDASSRASGMLSSASPQPPVIRPLLPRPEPSPPPAPPADSPDGGALPFDDSGWMEAASQLIDNAAWSDSTPSESSVASSMTTPHGMAGPEQPSSPPVAEQPALKPAAEPPAAELRVEPPAAEPRVEGPAAEPRVEPPAGPRGAEAAPPPVLPPPEPPRFPTPLLSVRKLTACIDARTILRELDLELGPRGVYALMGPGGSGKSSLNGILCGRNRTASGWTLSGEILYDGAPLGAARRPPLVGQRLEPSTLPLRAYLLAELADGVAASFPDSQIEALLARVGLSRLRGSLTASLAAPGFRLTRSEQWRLAIARELVAEPRLLCVDEPTASMEDAEAAPILDLLRAEGAQRAVLFVTHNQTHARMCSDYVILLAEGQLQEYGLAVDFFNRPFSKAAQNYVRTGGCCLRSPDAHHDAAEVPSGERAATPGREPSAAPRGEELAPGSLAAAAGPRPGEAMVLWPCAAPRLSLRSFTLKVSNRPILSELNFDIATPGCYLIVAGDSGTRRLLIRALCGPRPSNFQSSGTMQYEGHELCSGIGPAAPHASAQLLMMKAAEYVASNLCARPSLSPIEQRAAARELIERAGFAELLSCLDSPMTDIEPHERRILEILRVTAAQPALIVLDDPLGGLAAPTHELLLSLLRRQAAERGLLIIAPDAQPYASLTARLAFLTEGRLDAQPRTRQATEEALDAARADDQSAATAPAPGAPQGEQPLTAVGQRRLGQGPRGFQWLRRGALAGMPAPGLTGALGYDLGLVRDAGISALVSLTMEPLPPEALAELGLASLFFPIEDMGAPSEAAAAALAASVAEVLARKQAVAFHCRAGLGRTGTMLAAQLIFEGCTAEAALAQVRAVEPGWVQSEKQLRFLHRYAEWLRQGLAQKSRDPHVADLR